MYEIAVLCHQGDLRITWDDTNPDQVLNARREIAALKQAGYSFFIADGSPADEVAAGRGELTFRRVDDPIEAMTQAEPVPEPAPKKRRGRPPKAIATPPMRGG